MRRQARDAIQSGDLKRAARLLRKAAGVKKRSERLAWLLVAAELEHAKKRYDRAGLAAMRLVILHPRSEHVGTALYWAARSYEGLQRPRKAIELYNECLRKTSKRRNAERSKRGLGSIRKHAKARLAAMRKQVPDR